MQQPEVLSAELQYGDSAATRLIALLVHSAISTRWLTQYVGRVDVTVLLAIPLAQHGRV